MVYFRSYWSHLDISTTICSHQMAAVRFELTTLGFRGMAPSHCAIRADDNIIEVNSSIVMWYIVDHIVVLLKYYRAHTQYYMTYKC